MESLTIAVASGKGGTGKTSVAANLALSLADTQYIDCDVEAPDGSLFLHPDLHNLQTVTLPVPRIDPELCTLCGECAEACEFNALAMSKQRVLVFDDLCHGCGLCSYVCPEQGAVTEVGRRIGDLESGDAPDRGGGRLAFVQGTLKIGEHSAVPVIKAAKQQAAAAGTVILDAPPGTACPMVEAVRGADYCLLVTEPTPFGLNDLELAVGVTRQLGVPCGVVLNRSDIGDTAVSDFCARERIPVLLEIPFDRSLAEAYSRGIPWVEVAPAWRERFRSLFRSIQRELAT